MELAAYQQHHDSDIRALKNEMQEVQQKLAASRERCRRIDESLVGQKRHMVSQEKRELRQKYEVSKQDRRAAERKLKKRKRESL